MNKTYKIQVALPENTWVVLRNVGGQFSSGFYGYGSASPGISLPIEVREHTKRCSVCKEPLSEFLCSVGFADTCHTCWERLKFEANESEVRGNRT